MALSTFGRQQNILVFIERNHQVSVQMLCDKFGISLATARRDLDALAERGLVKRIHGGALAAQNGQLETPALHRANDQTEAKARIGLAAAELIRDDETIFLSSGTTVLEASRLPAERASLT